MADRHGWDRLIRDVEERVLSAFSTHSFRAAASVSLAHGFLREALNSCSSVSADLEWLAFVVPPFDRDNWWIVSPRDEESATALEVLAPAAAAARIARRCRDLRAATTEVRPGAAATVSLSDFAGWSLADGIVQVVGLYVNVSITPDRPGLEGALLLGLGHEAGADLITALEDGVEHAGGCVRDRLRLAYARDATPVRVIASLDDAFQEHLGRARQALGLREFLVQLEGGSLQPVDHCLPPAAVSLSEAATATDAESGPDASDIHKAFEDALGALRPPGRKTVIALRVAASPSASLRTPVGDWLGWCEFRYGLASLRAGRAVLTTANDPTTLNAELARYARGAAHSARGLVVLVPGHFEAGARLLLEQWRETFDVSCAIYDPPN